jgi:hypothetical protein
MPILKQFYRGAKDTVFGRTVDTAMAAQRTEMADARRGALYFLGNTNAVAVPAMDLGAVSSYMFNTTILSDLKAGSLYIIKQTGPGRAVIDKASELGQSLAAAMQPVSDMIKRFFAYIQKKLGEMFGIARDGMEAIFEYLVWASHEITQVLVKLIPGWGYVQAAADIYAGARQAVDGAIRFIDQTCHGLGVSLLGGHPSLIANALARHSLAMVGGGLKDIAVGSTKIALTAAGDAMAGVGALFSAISGALQRIFNLIDRAVQRIRLNSILSKAREEWKIADSGQGLAASHKDFSEWFQNAVITTPVIAVLVLGSGFAAHPYRFLQLIKTDSSIVTQAEFSKGVKYIDRLKGVAGRYIRDYTDAYSTRFVSDDELIAARLNELINGQRTIEAGPKWVDNPLYESPWKVNPLYQAPG